MIQLKYSSYADARKVPNVIVDGAPTESTVLALSHWPSSKAPAMLMDDLSAQMALRYLDYLRDGMPALHGAAETVSNNHFDQDGLVSVFVLVEPAFALSHRERLVDLASAGDFGVYRDRASARMAMLLSAYADPDRSPLGAAAVSGGGACDALYHALLAQLPSLLKDNAETVSGLIADEDAALSACLADLQSGRLSIEEQPELDLALVRDPHGVLAQAAKRLGERANTVIGMAINNATQRTCVAFLGPARYEVVYRYESWVQFKTRSVRRRRDLSGLARRLNDREGGAVWAFDDVTNIMPRLRAAAEPATKLSQAEFCQALTNFLVEAPEAWDPATGQP